MSSRQEEKERRREERLAREKAEARAAARRKRLQYVLGGLLAIGAVAGVVALAAFNLGGSSEEAPGSPSQPDVAAAELPQQKTGDLKAAAEAAGCELKSPKIDGATHQTKTFSASDYKTNPPTSGDHTPDWYEDGIYEPGNAPELGKTVHTLEHGRIDVQYKRGTSAETVKKLEALLGEQSEGYHMLLFQNETEMPFAIAATAWGQLLGCKKMNDDVFDALRTFRARYVDKGPEAVP